MPRSHASLPPAAIASATPPRIARASRIGHGLVPPPSCLTALGGDFAGPAGEMPSSIGASPSPRSFACPGLAPLAARVPARRISGCDGVGLNSTQPAPGK